MRLLNVRSLCLESFIDPTTRPKYAILSHTWGEGEVLFSDVYGKDSAAWDQMPSAQKVRDSCLQTLRDGYNYIWIDTCCIDKSNGAELSEAINSMFEWYRQADVCYAYLNDATVGSSIDNCRWFTRGWTLQELIAPDKVLLFDRNWEHLGSKSDLVFEISRITGVHQAALTNGSKFLYSFPIATRMSWASKRLTTKEEDKAYSLMGLFNVNMPLLYGEGRKAFQRLQQEILEIRPDNSILAFTGTTPDNLLAQGPDDFVSGLYRTRAPYWKNSIRITPFSISLDVLLLPIGSEFVSNTGFFLAVLDDALGEESICRVAICLKKIGLELENTFIRVMTSILLIRPDVNNPEAYVSTNAFRSSITIVPETTQYSPVSATSLPVFRLKNILQSNTRIYTVASLSICTLWVDNIEARLAAFEFTNYIDQRFYVNMIGHCHNHGNALSVPGSGKVWYKVSQSKVQTDSPSDFITPFFVSAHVPGLVNKGEHTILTEEGPQRITAQIQVKHFLDRMAVELIVKISE